MISVKLNDGVTFEELDHEIWKVLHEFSSQLISEKELKRLNIKIRTAREFQDQGLLNRAMNLCFFELLGDAAGINEDLEVYNSITPEHLKEIAKQVLKKQNCSVLRIKKEM
jgi:predicted Zn-dependent peptidase